MCLLLITLVVSLFLLIFPSTVKTPQASDMFLYENTTAAVEDFPTFHVKEVFIYQSPNQPDAVHKMKIFLAKQSCDHLPYHVLPDTSQSLSPPHNKTLYLLKGSELKYNICAATNVSDEPDAFMKFHVVSGLHRGRKHYCSLTVYLGYSESLPDDKEPNHQWNCKSISCTINKNGYYSALHHTYPSSNIPFEDVKVWHQTNNSYKVINLHSLPSFCQDSRSETHEKSKTCGITIENSMHAWISQHQCVVVDVSTKADMLDTSNLTRVHTEFSYRDTGRNLFYIFGCVLIAFPLAVLIILTLIGIQKCYRVRR